MPMTVLMNTSENFGILTKISQTHRVIMADTGPRKRDAQALRRGGVNPSVFIIRFVFERRSIGMAQPRLRIFCETQESDTEVSPRHRSDQVTVPLCEIFPLLADAVQSKRTWLEDFGDEEISISADLYDVIVSYQHFRRPSA